MTLGTPDGRGVLSRSPADIADTPLGAELGDIDGDLDIDVLVGARNETPRLFRNRVSEDRKSVV